MLQVLAELASTIAQAPLMADLVEGFRAFLGQLGAQYLSNFDSAMGQHEGRRSFLGRELLLAATRVVLSQPDPANPQQKVPPHMAMLMLSHAIAALNELDDERADDGPILVGFPEELALDMVCNQAFHDQDDIYSVLDRQLRLWNVFGPRVAPKLGGKTPEELLQEATGLSVKDFLALGLALYAHFLGWKPGQPARLLDDFSSELPENTKQRFRELVAATTDDLASQCATPHGRSGIFCSSRHTRYCSSTRRCLSLTGRFCSTDSHRASIGWSTTTSKRKTNWPASTGRRHGVTWSKPWQSRTFGHTHQSI